MLRRMLFLLLLAAAVGIPYFSSNSPGLSDRLNTWWNSQPAASDRAAGEARELIGAWDQPTGAAQPMEPIAPGAGPVPHAPIAKLADVLRFDVSPDWVRANWPRSSTVLGEADSYALRVPLLSGTSIDDVAGAITYYFDPQQRVTRIFLNGRTGDPRKIVALARSRFQMLPRMPRTQGEQLYQYRWNDQPVGELAIRPADTFSHADPYANYRVELDVLVPGQPGPARPLEPLFSARPSLFQ
ncbi:MAG: hypothetical protein KDA42_01730 [Planctomycetales bacterium]|nr:hypothetical protein [Planctomycetales bacterium]